VDGVKIRKDNVKPQIGAMADSRLTEPSSSYTKKFKQRWYGPLIFQRHVTNSYIDKNKTNNQT